jgi:hypothetical protein
MLHPGHEGVKRTNSKNNRGPISDKRPREQKEKEEKEI